MKKKQGSIILSILFIGMILSPLVLAETAEELGRQTTQGIVDFFSGAKGALEPLFGTPGDLTKIFFGILLFMIVYSIVTYLFPGKEWMAAGATLLVTLISFLLIPDEFIEILKAQYGAMGVAMLTTIPFAILTLFTLRIGSGFLGQLTWIFYSVYFLGMILYKIFETGWDSVNAIYILAFIGGIAMIFLVKPIRNAIFHGHMEEMEEEGMKIVKRGKLLHNLQKEELEGVYGKGK